MQRNVLNSNNLGNELQGLRPKIPRHAHPMIVDLLEKCWLQDPSLRPEFSEITRLLQQTPPKEVGKRCVETVKIYSFVSRALTRCWNKII
uniref:Uncharacterized protein n=1 Tax=Cucumis sativus TaxID=3659 RepID=A0A0A0LJ86_CUCSA